MMEGEEKLKSQVFSGNLTEKSGVPEGMRRAVRRCLRPEREKRYATARAFLTDWRQYKRAGRGRILMFRMEEILKIGFLYAAVYIIWYRPECLSLAGHFLMGYLWLKAAEWIYRVRNEKWEQKRSVWCRSAG